MSQLVKFAPVALLGLLLPAGGCDQAPVIDAQTLAMHRTRLALAEEPEGVQTVADVRVALLGESHDPHAGHNHAEHDPDGGDPHGHAADEHAGHDHDGDGHEDHDAEDHDADDHDDHDLDDAADARHDQDDDDHGGHDHEADAEGDGGHAGHDDDHAGHNHDDHAEGTESIEVNMVGHIGGLANPWAEAQPEFPFAKTQAVLFLADPQGVIENEASGHAHAPGEECAFCAAHAADQADMLAMVQFVDENGDVLPMDVRQLFDVKEQDMVVVRGRARVTAGGILVVDAQGLYIRR